MLFVFIITVVFVFFVTLKGKTTCFLSKIRKKTEGIFSTFAGIVNKEKTSAKCRERPENENQKRRTEKFHDQKSLS